MNTVALKMEPEAEIVLEEFIPYRLSILSNAVSGSIATIYSSSYDLTIPEWRVIVILGRFPGLSAIDVAERTLMDKVAVSRAVARLIKNGRINRRFADVDRRRSILNLSDDGHELLREITPMALKFEASLLEGLTDAEINVFNRVVDSLLSRAQDAPINRHASVDRPSVSKREALRQGHIAGPLLKTPATTSA